MTDTREALHHFYAEYISAKAGVTDKRIVEAFTAIKREHFVGPGPWQIWTNSGYISTGTASPGVLYQDILIESTCRPRTRAMRSYLQEASCALE